MNYSVIVISTPSKPVSSTSDFAYSISSLDRMSGPRNNADVPDVRFPVSSGENDIVNLASDVSS